MVPTQKQILSNTALLILAVLTLITLQAGNGLAGIITLTTFIVVASLTYEGRNMSPKLETEYTIGGIKEKLIVKASEHIDIEIHPHDNWIFMELTVSEDPLFNMHIGSKSGSTYLCIYRPSRLTTKIFKTTYADRINHGITILKHSAEKLETKWAQEKKKRDETISELTKVIEQNK